MIKHTKKIIHGVMLLKISEQSDKLIIWLHGIHILFEIRLICGGWLCYQFYLSIIKKVI